MKVSASYAVYSGAELHFPAVSAALVNTFPNLSPMLRLVSDITATTLQRQTRWTNHVIHQLTFSYLTSDYVVATVSPVLRQLPPLDGIPAYQTLCNLVSEIASGRQAIDAQTVRVLNSTAFALLAALEGQRYELFRDSLSTIGRLAFRPPSSSTEAQVARFFNLFSFTALDRLSPELIARRFREELSFDGYTDAASLKAQTIQALIRLREDFLRTSSARCVFFCEDIQMNGPAFTLGDVQFTAADDLRSKLESDNALAWVETTSSKHPHAAYAVVDVACHPSDLHTAADRATAELDTILGYVASRANRSFSPPSRYTWIAVSVDSTALAFGFASCMARDSVLFLRPDDGENLQLSYNKFVSPALREPVEALLREKLRRVFRTLRRASFSAGCHEYSQAFASAWQAYEVVFGGTESRDRGDSISKRVASVAILPNAVGTTDNYVLTPEDFLEFARAFASGSLDLQFEELATAALLAFSKESAPTADDARMLQMSMNSDEVGQILDWKGLQLSANASARTETELEPQVVRRRDELRRRLQQCYKLRNDIVHSGYDDEGAARPMYAEVSTLFGSFVLNLAYHFARHKTYVELLNALDLEWQRGRACRQDDDGAVRSLAFDLWKRRGRPLGDDLTDWFTAREKLGLD